MYYNSTGGADLLEFASNATPAYTTSHYVNITGLAGTVYYKVSSSDKSGNQANSTVYSVSPPP